jgi:hypothetical protein
MTYAGFRQSIKPSAFGQNELHGSEAASLTRHDEGNFN